MKNAWPAAIARSAFWIAYSSLLLLMPVSSTDAASWYAATNGSDIAGTGGVNNPWRTVAYASSLMSGGDTLNLRSGTYVETNWMWQNGKWKSGTPNNTTVIQSFPGERAILQQQDPSALEVLRVTASSNIVFNSLVLDNSLATTNTAGTTVVKLTGTSTFITISNCIIRNSPRGHGILMNSSDGEAVTSHLITGCLFTNIAYYSQVGDSPPHCIYLQCGSNIVEHCIFEHGHQDFCIHNYDPQAIGNVYRLNIFRNCGRAIGLIHGGFNQVYNNLIYSNASIAIQMNSGTFSNSVANNTIMRLTSSGILLDSCFGNNIENNLVAECSGGWAIGVNDTATNTVLRNNLCCSNAIYYAGDYMHIQGVGTVTNANKFGDAFNAGLVNPPRDMHLLSTSDAIRGGVPQILFSDDFVGRSRAAGWSIGAYEYVAPVGSLGPPSNLRVIPPN